MDLSEDSEEDLESPEYCRRKEGVAADADVESAFQYC